MALVCAWKAALETLPAEVQDVIQQDGYTSAAIFKSCFWDENLGSRYERINKYGHGLFIIRKVVAGISAETLEFNPLMGRLRGLLDASGAVMKKTERAAEEMAERAEEVVA